MNETNNNKKQKKESIFRRLRRNLLVLLVSLICGFITVMLISYCSTLGAAL